MYVCFILFFFFQAEDGIRDHCVTGVQTCALPILFHERCERLSRPGISCCNCCSLLSPSSFDLDCASARYFEGPRPVIQRSARRRESWRRRETGSTGPYLRYRKWKAKDDKDLRGVERVLRMSS